MDCAQSPRNYGGSHTIANSVGGWFLATDVIYDVTTYLPSDMPAKQAQSFMEEKFGQAATAYVLLPDMPLWQAGEVKESIAALPGVEGVQWLMMFRMSAYR